MPHIHSIEDEIMVKTALKKPEIYSKLSELGEQELRTIALLPLGIPAHIRQLTKR